GVRVCTVRRTSSTPASFARTSHVVLSSDGVTTGAPAVDAPGSLSAVTSEPAGAINFPSETRPVRLRNESSAVVVTVVSSIRTATSPPPTNRGSVGFAGPATSQNSSTASTDPSATAAVPGAAASNSFTGSARAGGDSVAPAGTLRSRAVVTAAGNSTR